MFVIAWLLQTVGYTKLDFTTRDKQGKDCILHPINNIVFNPRYRIAKPGFGNTWRFENEAWKTGV